MSRHVDSYYAATANGLVERPALRGEVTADVAVVGGGYTGLSTALALAERGRKVVVVEAERIGWGASGRNGGQLHTGQRKDQDALEASLGKAKARALWDVAEAAKANLKGLIARHAIDCDWRPGLIYAQHKPRNLAADHAYAERLARDYDYPHVAVLGRDELAAAIGTGVYSGGFRDADAGHLHPLNLALGIARAAEAAGATFHEASPVTRIGTAGGKQVVETAAGRVTASDVVLAGNGYLEGIEPEVEARVMPINNYILATEPLGERAKRIIPGWECVADSRFVIYYWRLSADGRMLFGGGESYTRAFPADIKGFVRKHLLAIYPDLADARIDYAWGGTLAVTPSRLPFIRRLRPGVYAACGYSGQGVALANFAGRMIADMLAGDTERFDLMASLKHMPFPGGKWFRTPALALAMTYYALRDRI